MGRLRQQGYGTPVLMLTARGELTDRVAGLDAGADDYLCSAGVRHRFGAVFDVACAHPAEGTTASLLVQFAVGVAAGATEDEPGELP